MTDARHRGRKLAAILIIATSTAAVFLTWAGGLDWFYGGYIFGLITGVVASGFALADKS